MITGASGFIGQAAVKEAISQGLEVVAVVRNTVPDDWRGVPGLSVLRCDLSDPNAADILADSMGVDAVVHAAAHLGSDQSAQNRDTVTATETVLHAMLLEGVKSMILISSLGVYDTSRLWPGAQVTEETPIEESNKARDGYVRGKLMQEALCQRAAERRGFDLCILRPGAVYGPSRTWNAHVGVGVGPLLMRVGRGGEIPLCHVDTVARAIVAAARQRSEGVFNVLDDDRPNRKRFVRAHRQSGWPTFTLPAPWWLFLLAGYVLDILPGKKPGLLRPPVLKARMMPLRYSNAKIRKFFGLAESDPFEQLLINSIREEQA